ncbi:MAG: NGG1p interacting factor NIF3 [Methanobacteriota archaeon]|nr:MAG: NGG1p interacting factor NIF3 [Euryarchaeota archaeon]
MNVKQVYELALRLGIEADPRGKAYVRKELKKGKEAYEKLDDDEKEEFDTERLTNPYSDTRILYGDPKKKVKRALVGIDMTTGEVVLADRLGEKGKKIDLILGHHPRGKALAELHDVMHLQEEFLRGLGVPINIAEGVMKKRIAEVERRLMPANHNQPVDAARILDIPIITTHTPADNIGYKFVQTRMNRKKPDTIGDLIKTLKDIPEYKEGMGIGSGPKIIVGSKKKKAGKVIVKFTGGTSPSKEVYKELSDQGVGTVIGMHVPEEHLEERRKYHMSFVVAGHMSSDSIGMNKICDEMEKKGVEIIPCSGFIRVNRK